MTLNEADGARIAVLERQVSDVREDIRTLKSDVKDGFAEVNSKLERMAAESQRLQIEALNENQKTRTEALVAKWIAFAAVVASGGEKLFNLIRGAM